MPVVVSDQPAPGQARCLLVLTAIGLLVRIAFLLLEPHATLAGDEPAWVDLGVHGLATLRSAFSPFRSRAIIFYPPAYPYFLGAFFALFGSLQAVKWAQVVVSALLVPAVGRIGGLVFSSRIGLLAAGIAALFPELLFFSVHFWSETLFLSLLFWGFERALTSDCSGRVAAGVVAGVLWGLAALTRETVLSFALVVAAWLALGGRARRGGGVRAAGFLLATVLSVAPWTWRNWIVFHAFVPVSTVSAHALWQGNTLLPLDEFYQQTDSVPGPIAQYRLARERALTSILERQPTWLLEKLGHELPALWGPQSHLSVLLDSAAYGPVGPRARRIVLACFVAPYLVVVVLCLPGIAALHLDRRRWLLLLFFAYYNAIHVLAYGQDRYRLPMMPLLFLVAAAAWTAWRTKAYPSLSPWRRALLWALSLIAAAVILPGFFS